MGSQFKCNDSKDKLLGIHFLWSTSSENQDRNIIFINPAQRYSTNDSIIYKQFKREKFPCVLYLNKEEKLTISGIKEFLENSITNIAILFKKPVYGKGASFISRLKEKLQKYKKFSNDYFKINEKKCCL